VCREGGRDDGGEGGDGGGLRRHEAEEGPVVAPPDLRPRARASSGAPRTHHVTPRARAMPLSRRRLQIPARHTPDAAPLPPRSHTLHISGQAAASPAPRDGDPSLFHRPHRRHARLPAASPTCKAAQPVPRAGSPSSDTPSSPPCSAPLRRLARRRGAAPPPPQAHGPLGPYTPNSPAGRTGRLIQMQKWSNRAMQTPPLSLRAAAAAAARQELSIGPRCGSEMTATNT
jgi:hypothetical protein